jgi:hypothetical protein
MKTRRNKKTGQMEIYWEKSESEDNDNVYIIEFLYILVK